MSTELVERLRPRIEGTGIWRTAGPDEDMQALADELTAITARAQDAEAALQTYFKQLLSEHNAKVALLTEALRPFATFAENNTDDEGWAGSTCQRDRICDWFGPSEFRAASRALSQEEWK